MAVDAPGLLELFAYVGTYSGWVADPINLVTMILRGPAPGIDTDVAVTVTGPGAWGSNAYEAAWLAGRISMPSGRSSFGSKVVTAVSAAPEVEVSAGGASARRTLIVDAELTLPQPTSMAVVPAAVDDVLVRWDPVPGANVYPVEFGPLHARYTSIYHSESPEFDAAVLGLNLDPDDARVLRVLANSIDLWPAVVGDIEPPPSQQVNIVISGSFCFCSGDEVFGEGE